jgi:hypothetical protein
MSGYDINTCKDPALIAAHRLCNAICRENTALEAAIRHEHELVDRRFLPRVRDLDARYQAAENEFMRLHDLWAARQRERAA